MNKTTKWMLFIIATIFLCHRGIVSAESQNIQLDWQPWDACCIESIPGKQKTSLHPPLSIAKILPLGAIIIYQKIISPQAGGVCNFTPSCSGFGLEAIKKYGVIEGILMTSDRLQRCHYCVSGEYYYGPEGRFYDSVRNHCLSENLHYLEHEYVVKESFSKEMLDFAANRDSLPHKSPLAAGIMSLLFPGSGQMYLHRFGDGTFSMLLTLGTTWLGHHYLQQGDKTAGNILSGLGYVFYTGNIYGAAASAKLINASYQANYLEQIKEREAAIESWK